MRDSTGSSADVISAVVKGLHMRPMKGKQKKISALVLQ